MSQYIKLATLEYPRHEGDIRLEHPEILESQTGDTFPCPKTYAFVAVSEPPLIDGSVQSMELGAPFKDITGQWKVDWVVRDLTPEELAEIAQASAAMRPEFERQNGHMP